MCGLDCGPHGSCVTGACVCHPGWAGALCDVQLCHPRCEEHGQCVNGSCICQQGWNGRHCSLEGCGQGCGGHGSCGQNQGGLWACTCEDGWGGETCQRRQETECQDEIDNDKGNLGLLVLLLSYLPPSHLTHFSFLSSLALSQFSINWVKNIQSFQFNFAASERPEENNFPLT